jgi:hypothetical protein
MLDAARGQRLRNAAGRERGNRRHIDDHAACFHRLQHSLRAKNNLLNLRGIRNHRDDDFSAVSNLSRGAGLLCASRN